MESCVRVCRNFSDFQEPEQLHETTENVILVEPKVAMYVVTALKAREHLVKKAIALLVDKASLQARPLRLLDTT